MVKKSKIPANTSRAYESTIIILRKLFGNNWLDTLENDTKEVSKTLKETYTNNNTLRAYYSRIIKILRDNEAEEDAIDFYVKKMKKYAMKVNEKVDDDELTKNQEKTFIKWNEILKMVSKMKKVKDDSFNQRQDYLIMRLYTLLPPLRNDYANLRVVKKVPKNKVNNYFILDEKNPQIILNNYKTAKTYGQLIINKFPKALKTELKDWFDNWNTSKKYLLVKKNLKTPLNKDDIINRIRKIFNEYTGKKASINILRHSYLSYVWPKLTNGTHGKRKEISIIMGHSVSTQSSYTKKKGKK